MQDLYIAIDPGFDTVKVAANGKVFKFPFAVVETDERKMNDYNLRDSFLCHKDEHGITSRVGMYAQELIFEQKDRAEVESQMEDFYTERRFTSGAFKIGLQTAIALAIQNENFPANYVGTIYLMVALPHACRSRYAPSVVGAAAGDHHFFLRSGTGSEIEYRFHIQEKNIFTVSQTIASILGETSDDHGNVDKQKFFYLSNGPTLILDGGYYTMGIVEMSKGGSVDDDKTESDTQHAMRNVNMAIADEIKSFRPDIHHYMVEYLLREGNGQIRYMDHGHAAILDLKKIRKAKIRQVCSDFIKHLNAKYNNLLDVNYVLMTGGTGACFYPQVKAYYERSGVMDDQHLLLADSSLYKQSHPIEYSIVIGAYKGLLGKLEH